MKSNRNIKLWGRWTTPDDIPLNYSKSEILRISGDDYIAEKFNVYIKSIGNVSIVLSYDIDKGNRNYYVTNRIDWNLKKILETYLHRWDIEVIHKDLKRNGLDHIFIRKIKQTELYLRLIITGRIISEISSARSLNNYKYIPIIEKRKRWIYVTKVLRYLYPYCVIYQFHDYR